jgi:hypothetical protein
MPDDHSEVVPLLPIPNRTVKRLCADDSADSRVKVGHRQALTAANAQQKCWAFCFVRRLFQEVVCEKTASQFARPGSLAGKRAQVFASCRLIFSTLR